MDRTTWNSATAIDCAPHSPTPKRHRIVANGKTSVETENGERSFSLSRTGFAFPPKFRNTEALCSFT
jgi:hypothetical protein